LSFSCYLERSIRRGFRGFRVLGFLVLRAFFIIGVWGAKRRRIVRIFGVGSIVFGLFGKVCKIIHLV
jgi:hypothetical protein